MHYISLHYHIGAYLTFSYITVFLTFPYITVYLTSPYITVYYHYGHFLTCSLIFAMHIQFIGSNLSPLEICHCWSNLAENCFTAHQMSLLLKLRLPVMQHRIIAALMMSVGVAILVDVYR